MDTVLIEARPARLGRLNRDLNIIEGATLIGPLSVNGANRKRRYSEAALKKLAAMAEGLPGYLNHTKPEDAFKPRDVRDLAVRHQNVRYDPTTQTVKADMYVLPSHANTVFSLAEMFGDHIGNSLVSKGAVTMEGDTEVVQDILQLRSADLVSDPASTKGLFEDAAHADQPLTILDLIESLKTTAPRGGRMLPDGIHTRVATLLDDHGRRLRFVPLAEASDHPVSDLKSDTPRDYAEFAPHDALAIAVQNFLSHPEDAPKRPPTVKAVTLRESWDDIKKKARPDTTLTEMAHALLFGQIGS